MIKNDLYYKVKQRNLLDVLRNKGYKVFTEGD